MTTTPQEFEPGTSAPISSQMGISQLQAEVDRLRQNLAESARAELHYKKNDRSLRAQKSVLVELAKRISGHVGELSSVLAILSEAAAETLEIERVNIWLFNEQRTEINCVEQFVRSSQQHQRGDRLIVGDYPIYFKALQTSRAIAAEDAAADARTFEFREAYFKPHGIGALIDAPVRREGRIVGIVCHEHVGGRRCWTPVEESFAGSIADFVSLALESAERRRAEDALRRAHVELECRVEERTQSLQRTNLQLQTEIAERVSAERRLQESQLRWQTLVANVPSHIITVNAAGTISFVNHVVSGLSEGNVIGSSCYDYVLPQWRPILQDAIARVFRTGEVVHYEVGGLGEGGANAWYNSVIGPLYRDGQVVEAVMISTNITDRKRAEEDLRRQKSILQLVLDSMGDGVTVIDEKGNTLVSNPAATQIVGRAYSLEPADRWHESMDIYSAEGMQKLAPNDLPLIHALHGESVTDAELYVRHADRPEGVWVSVNARPLNDIGGSTRGAVAVFRNITEKKKAQEAIEHKQRMLEQLLVAHERDRQLTAYEIHDGQVQYVTAAIMHLEAFLRLQAPGAGEALDEFQVAIKLLRNTLDEARRLISGLRPPILDEQGIVAAIEYLIEEQAAPSGIAIEFRHQVEHRRLQPLVEGTIFRIVQEALNNIRKHSQSHRALVTLQEQQGQLLLEIEDWGVGFDLNRVPDGHFGLAGIRERARHLRGTATIESVPGAGTRVRVALPLSGAISHSDSRSDE